MRISPNSLSVRLLSSANQSTDARPLATHNIEGVLLRIDLSPQPQPLQFQTPSPAYSPPCIQPCLPSALPLALSSPTYATESWSPDAVTSIYSCSSPLRTRGPAAASFAACRVTILEVQLRAISQCSLAWLGAHLLRTQELLQP